MWGFPPRLMAHSIRYISRWKPSSSPRRVKGLAPHSILRSRMQTWLLSLRVHERNTMISQWLSWQNRETCCLETISKPTKATRRRSLFIALSDWPTCRIVLRHNYFQIKRVFWLSSLTNETLVTLQGTSCTIPGASLLILPSVWNNWSNYLKYLPFWSHTNNSWLRFAYPRFKNRHSMSARGCCFSHLKLTE